MIEFQEEQLIDCLEEMKPLLEAHWLEVAKYQDKIAFSPDYDRYFLLENQGMLHIATARDDGKLVGYYISIVAPSLHYSQDLFAVNDVLFLDPEYRSKDTGYQMFKFAEKCLKVLGVSVMTIHMKTDLPFDSLCEARGFENIERLYSKYIGA